MSPGATAALLGGALGFAALGFAAGAWAARALPCPHCLRIPSEVPRASAPRRYGREAEPKRTAAAGPHRQTWIPPATDHAAFPLRGGLPPQPQPRPDGERGW